MAAPFSFSFQSFSFNSMRIPFSFAQLSRQMQDSRASGSKLYLQRGAIFACIRAIEESYLKIVENRMAGES